MTTDDRYEVQRTIPADAATIFAILCDPRGHVAIDASGMLQDASGSPVTANGDTFVVHMDRESVNDLPIGKYDVTVEITAFEPDRLIEWTVGPIEPPIGHRYGFALEPTAGGTQVTHYYDWSQINDERRAPGIIPVIPERGLRATLGILERTVANDWLRW